VVGQSGTASPTFVLVTIPPLQMSNSAATQMNHVKRFSQFLDPGEFPEFIRKKITADHADFADEFL
jgi:hypothetical protein